MSDTRQVTEGTEIEKREENLIVADDIFSDTFDVAISDKESDNDSEIDTSGVEDTSADTENNNIEEDSSSTENIDESESETEVESNSEEDYKQKYKSLDGILKSNQKKYDDNTTVLLSQIQVLTDKLNSMEQGNKGDAAKDDNDDLTAEQKAALEEYEKDFDAVSKMEGIKRDRELKKLKQEILNDIKQQAADLKTELTGRVEPIEQILQKDDEVKHFNYLKSEHPDYETYRDNGSIAKWIDSKPKYMQPALNQIYQTGSAEDVASMITDFKNETNIKIQNAQTVEKQKQIAIKKQALTAVPSKKAAVSIKHSDPADFDSAFDKAIKDLKS